MTVADFVPEGSPYRRVVPPKPRYAVAELAWLLGVHEDTARALVDEGVIPSVREGRRVFVTARQLDAYVARLEREAVERETRRAPVTGIGARRA